MRHEAYEWFEMFAVGRFSRMLVRSRTVRAFVAELGSRPENVGISVCRYNNEIYDYKKKNKTVSGFRGPCYADYLVLDVDAKDAEHLAEAVDAQLEVLAVLKKLGIGFKNLADYFSGNRGHHILVPIHYFGEFEPDVRFPQALMDLAILLFEDSGLITRDGNIYTSDYIDFELYRPLHCYRMPGTIHEKTQLWKIPLRENEIHSPEIIRSAASAPRPSFSPVDMAPNARLLEIGEELRRRIRENDFVGRVASDVQGTFDIRPQSPIDLARPGFARLSAKARRTLKLLEGGIKESESVGDIKGRRAALLHLVVRMKNVYKMDKPTATMLLSHWNKTNQPPLEEREFHQVINDLYA